MDLDFYRPLLQANDRRILMLVMDGLGGLPRHEDGDTELEAATTPHLDALALRGICGLHTPVGPGITPGSGPAHLGIFGYDPVKYVVGRGVLAALGIGFDLQPGDVAARGNFCSVDEDGKVTDRRAGRIPTEKGRELCEILAEIEIEGVEVHVEVVKEYRFLLVLRGEGLDGRVADTDPQAVGADVLTPRALDDRAQRTAELAGRFQAEARRRLADHHPANMVLLRGFSQKPDWPTFAHAFGLRAAAVAGYPMYRGVARLLGMEVLETGSEPEELFGTVVSRWGEHDFVYLHVKPTDSAGEDGDFDRKVKLIERTDALLPEVLKLEPDVVVVTGDHSTPSTLRSHSWHPVPTLLWAPTCRPDAVSRFGERACLQGALGPRFPARDLMPLALAHAQRLEKFGA